MRHCNSFDWCGAAPEKMAHFGMPMDTSMRPATDFFVVRLPYDKRTGGVKVLSQDRVDNSAYERRLGVDDLALRARGVGQPACHGVLGAGDVVRQHEWARHGDG